jgi:transcription initiation factor TFIIF subunit alpha
MRGAERPEEIPDDVDGDDDDELTGTGREIKKLVKKTDKSGAYESDDDENPYASVRPRLLSLSL